MDHGELNDRIQAHLQGRGELTEGRVLDGDGYFLDGLLVAAVIGEDLCLHVGRDDWQTTLAEDGVRPLLFADLPVPGWVIIDGASVDDDEALAGWIESALARR
ncbi:MAG: hypothetical protein ACRDWS_09275 [Acidimicrobiia bacterium]